MTKEINHDHIEPTLRELGEQAAANYRIHRRSHEDVESSKWSHGWRAGKVHELQTAHDALAAQLEGGRMPHPFKRHKLKGIASGLEFHKEYLAREPEVVEENQDSYDRIVAAHADHYAQKAGEYHELAVIEAHLDGVEINVRKRVELGHQTEDPSH